MVKLLRLHKPWAVVNLPRSQRASVAAFLARVPLRLGWSEGLGAFFNNRAMSFHRSSGHQMERYSTLLRMGWPDVTPNPASSFRPRTDAQREADVLLKGFPEPFVALALGAACWNKRLGLPVWAALASILKERGFAAILLGSAGEDQELAKELMAQVPGLRDLTGRATLPVTAGLIVRSEGLVGNDSALAHLSAACGVPTIVAFGPTDPALTAPPGAWVRTVRREDLPCLPCRRMDCQREGHPCMQALDPGPLAEALRELQTWGAGEGSS
jgi:ADP-heptose:LPS heptosyltransferase